MKSRKVAYRKVTKEIRPLCIYLISYAKNAKRKVSRRPATRLLIEILLCRLRALFLNAKGAQNAVSYRTRKKHSGTNLLAIDGVDFEAQVKLVALSSYYSTCDVFYASIKEELELISKDMNFDSKYKRELWGEFIKPKDEKGVALLRRKVDHARESLAKLGVAMLSCDIKLVKDKEFKVLFHSLKSVNIQRFARVKNPTKSGLVNILYPGVRMVRRCVWVTKDSFEFLCINKKTRHVAKQGDKMLVDAFLPTLKDAEDWVGEYLPS